MKKNRMKLEMFNSKKTKIAAIITVLLSVLGFIQTPAFAATSVTKNGITWSFGGNYQTGQYVNGDYWVLDTGGGIQVTSVSPSPSGSSNGSVINPAGGSSQGYDGRVDGYNSSLRVSFPRTLSAGQSLVSTQSRNASANSTDMTGAAVQPAHCFIQRAAVLTVVSSVPNANSFRPPFVGTNKPTFLATNLDRSQLMKLPMSGKPAASYVTEVAGYFKEVWLDHKPGWTARMMHPISNMPNYGRDIGVGVSRAACLLLLDYTDAQLEPLLINFVQTGIDLYYTSQLSNNWYGDGGHANGRKWPILFAGIMLNNSAMKSVSRNFGEDDQTYYGTTASRNSGQSKVAYWGRNCSSSYTSSCSGSGTKDCKPSGSNADGCQDYRNCCTSYTWVGYALAAQLMGAEGVWNHGAFFDYVDRWMGYGNDPRVASGDWVQPGDAGTAFVKTMWNAYRSSVGNTQPPPPPTNQAPNANAGSDQTVVDADGNGSQAVILSSAGSSDSDGTISSYAWLENNQSIASGVSPSVTLAVGTHTITLRVTDDDGATDTDTVVIIVQPKPVTDTTPPAVNSITSGSSIKIVFDEPLNASIAQTASNYTINDGVTVTSAVYNNTEKSVNLSIANHSENNVYTLTLRNIRDLNNNVMPQTTEQFTYSSGLIGYWEFSETNGTKAVDCSGQQNDGTLVNGPVWTGTNELKFDGVNDAVAVPLRGCTVNAGTVTVKAYLDGSQGVRYFFGHTVGTTWSNRIQLYTSNGQLGVGMGSTHSSSVNIATLALNKWYNLALSWNATNYYVYLDGAQVASGTYTGLTTLAATADIGNDAGAARDESLNGKIDRCRIYNRCLSASEISVLADLDSSFAFSPIGDKEVDAGTKLTFAVQVNDPAVQVSLSEHNLPSLPSFVNNVFTWTPSASHVGTYECTFTAEYGLLEDSETITVKVNNLNRAPVIAPITSKSVNEGQALAFTVSASDPDGDTVTCTASGLPSGATFNGTSFQWTPSSSQSGSYTVQFTASDGSLTDTESVAITVVDVPGGGSDVTVIIDNSSSNCSSEGWWGVSGGATPYGTNSLWGRNDAAYTWTFQPTVTGNYDVSMWWSGQSNRPSSAPVSIQNSGTKAIVYVNQLQNAGKWNSLGQFNFVAGTAYRITITAPPVSSTCADAVKFTLTTQATPPPSIAPVIIDNALPSGQWYISGATGFYGANSIWARDGAVYTWTFRPTVTGRYDVSMWWTEWSSRATAIPVDIANASGTSRVTINQMLNGSKWNSLGSYQFTAGQSYSIRITSQPGPSSTCADAVRFTLQ